MVHQWRALHEKSTTTSQTNPGMRTVPQQRRSQVYQLYQRGRYRSTILITANFLLLIMTNIPFRKQPDHQALVRVMIQCLVQGQVQLSATRAGPYKQGTVPDFLLQLRILPDIDTLIDSDIVLSAAGGTSGRSLHDCNILKHCRTDWVKYISGDACKFTIYFAIRHFCSKLLKK